MNKVTIICGSQRPNAQSAKVMRFVRGQLEEHSNAEVYELDLAQTQLPFWIDTDEAKSVQDVLWAPIKDQIITSIGLVVIAPEWNGMVPPALKNFFLYCTDHELADRPAMIVGVSSGNGGTSPASELRLSSYRDTQICYLPEQVIIRRVTEVLNDAEKPASEDDAYIRFRIDNALALLMAYGTALENVRNAGIRRFDVLPYGM